MEITVTTTPATPSERPETDPSSRFAEIHCPTCGTRPITEFQAEFEQHVVAPVYGLTTRRMVVLDPRAADRVQPPHIRLRHRTCRGLALSETAATSGNPPLLTEDVEETACGHCGLAIDWPLEGYISTEHGRVHMTCLRKAAAPIPVDQARIALREAMVKVAMSRPSAMGAPLVHLLDACEDLLSAVVV